MASSSRWDGFGSGSGTVNNTRHWTFQCGGFGVDLRMGSGHDGRCTGKEMANKRSPVFVGKMI
jgi:hypothetical protein